VRSGHIVRRPHRRRNGANRQAARPFRVPRAHGFPRPRRTGNWRSGRADPPVAFMRHVHMIKGGLLLGGGNASIALLGLLRNVLIARMISVEDFGIAATFAITMAAVEMTSNIAIDRLIVQARDGDRPRFQATAQAFQAARGVLAAMLLYLLAEPIAALFGVPHVVWAYQAMALMPLLRGLVHLDMYRVQRDMRFRPSVTVEVSAQLLATLAAIPLAMQLGDWRAMLYALLL